MAKKSIDRRVARTRATLHEALLSLLGRQGYETVTVADICAAANVGRSTFYAHYTGKDDLMRSGLKHLREQLLARQAEASGSPHARSRRLGFSLAMFEHARDHRHLHQALIGNRGGTIALDMIRHMLCELVRRELGAGGGKNLPGAMPRELVVQYLVGAYMAVATWWLDGGAKLAPPEIDALFQHLVTEGIASLRA